MIEIKCHCEQGIALCGNLVLNEITALTLAITYEVNIFNENITSTLIYSFTFPDFLFITIVIARNPELVEGGKAILNRHKQ